MKSIMISVLILGLLTAGVALYGQAHTMAISATIVSGIADLRQENNADKCQIVEDQTSRLLRSIRDSFVPIMWIGVATAVAGLAGIVTIGRNRKMTAANQAAHDTARKLADPGR